MIIKPPHALDVLSTPWRTVSSSTRTGSVQCLLISSTDLWNMSSVLIFIRNLLRLLWLVFSTEMPLRCATDLVGEAHEAEMYLQNCL